MTLWMAGTSCVDFAAYGHQRGELGPMLRPFLLWIAEIRQYLPDIVIWEITLQKTQALLTNHLQELYDVCTFVLHPGSSDALARGLGVSRSLHAEVTSNSTVANKISLGSSKSLYSWTAAASCRLQKQSELLHSTAWHVLGVITTPHGAQPYRWNQPCRRITSGLS